MGKVKKFVKGLKGCKFQEETANTKKKDTSLGISLSDHN